MKLSKRQKAILAAVDTAKYYDAAEAMEEVIKAATAKFDETIELHIKLGVDTKQADQQVRGTVVLPNGTGRTVRVLVIAKGDKADAAIAAGADIVGAEDIIAKIANEGFLDFDVCITSPDMMGQMGRIARILGPRGLMPSPKSDTVTNDIPKAVKDSKAGKVEYRCDKTSIIHVPIGKKSFGAAKLLENYHELMEAIIKAKPAAAKGQYVRSVTASPTMGPGIKITYKPN